MSARQAACSASFLQSAVPKYNSETGDAKLFVEFADQLASIYVERPEAADEIRTIIEQMTGKPLEVQLILADQHAKRRALHDFRG